MPKAEVRVRTKMDVIRELNAVEKQMEGIRSNDSEAGSLPPLAMPGDLIRRKTLLKHELRVFDTKPVTGEEGLAIKNHWARQIEEARKAQEAEEKKEKEAIKKAKSQLKKEQSGDKEAAKALLKSLSPKQRAELLKEMA